LQARPPRWCCSPAVTPPRTRRRRARPATESVPRIAPESERVRQAIAENVRIARLVEQGPPAEGPAVPPRATWTGTSSATCTASARACWGSRNARVPHWVWNGPLVVPWNEALRWNGVSTRGQRRPSDDLASTCFTFRRDYETMTESGREVVSEQARRRARNCGDHSAGSAPRACHRRLYGRRDPSTPALGWKRGHRSGDHRTRFGADRATA
jgi:hypothetical protein